MGKALNYKNKLHKIKAFVFDFDGVLTNGDVWVFDNQEAIRCGNSKDGYALQYAVKKGYIIAVITGATSPSIVCRMNSLGVTRVYTGCVNKMPIYAQFLVDNGLQEDEVVCMGDDIPDYEMLQHCGVATCPADAVLEIKEMADYISLYPGGKGCVRDIIEQVLRLQDKWFHTDALHW